MSLGSGRDGESTALADEATSVDILGRRMANAVLLIEALGGGSSALRVVPPSEQSYIKTNTEACTLDPRVREALTMADSGTAKKMTQPGASFAHRYGLALASVTGALLLELLFHHFNLPHAFAAFALSAIAITFWYAGTKPGIVAVLFSSLIRSFIFEGETSALSRILYNLVFLLFAALMIWVRRSKDSLEVEVADRTARLTTANERLRREKEQLDGLFELSPDAVILTDDDFHVLRVNREFTRIFEYTAEEVAGQWLPELIMPEELRDEALKNRDRLISGDRVELEAIRQRKGGVRFDVSVAAKSISLGFDQVAVYFIYRDITERKRAEQALRKNEERWRSVFENSAIGVALTDLNGRFLATNHVYQTMVGYTEEELRALSFLDLTHEDYRDANWSLVAELLEGKRGQFQIEKKYLRKDGGSIWVSNNVSLVPGTERVPRFIMALSEDITQRKRTEEALRRSEGYLAEAQKLTHTGSWVWNLRTDALFWSQEVFRIYDYDPKKMGHPTWDFFERIHPEDRPQFEQRKKRLASAQKERADSKIDFRIVLPDGTIKHLQSIAHPVIESGDEVVGTVMDVTEQWEARAELEKAFEEIKQRTEALRRSEAYLAEAQRLAKTGSWAYNPAAENCIYWSDEMRRIFGLDLQSSNLPDREEFLRLVHPEDRARFNERIEKSRREKSDFVQDYRVVLTDGTVKHIHGIGHPLLDESGNITEYVGSDVDVTELKRTEEKLRRSEADLLEAQRISQTGSWKLDVSSGKVTVSPQIFRMFGVKPDEDTSKVDFWLSRNHVEDQTRIQELFEKSLNQKTDYDADYRIVLPDGTIKHLHAVGHPVFNESGELAEFVGTAIDVTEQAQARIELEKAFEEIKRLKDRLHDENLALREQIDQAFMFEEIVGASPALKSVLSSIVKVAPTDSTVLVTGETGTGKELIARAIHKHSQRSGQAFISVNCASIPSSLIASELFGHEKGAFTGAMQRRQGRFELAHSGTIFLDEVGELPTETQIALLRVLQEREFERVGGNRVIRADVRVIAATNRDLTAAIAGGTFRADLFYRLNVFPIQVPPLRKRKEDIPMLVEYFVKRYAEKAGKQIRKIDNNTLKVCQSYSWPGNIRELQNIVERSVILCGGDTFWIEKAWLSSPEPARQEMSGALSDALQNHEKEIIEAALADSKGKVAGPEGAAARLGIPRSTLDSKIKQLRINKHRFYV
jgi:PAS domain S-box-containing protein